MSRILVLSGYVGLMAVVSGSAALQHNLLLCLHWALEFRNTSVSLLSLVNILKRQTPWYYDPHIDGGGYAILYP